MAYLTSFRNALGRSGTLACMLLVSPAWALTPSWEALSSGGSGDPHVHLAMARVASDSGMIAIGTASGGSLLTVRIGADGSVLWTSRFAGGFSGNPNEYALALDPSDNVVVAGPGRIDGTGRPGWVLAKLRADDGIRQWVREVDYETFTSESRPILIQDSSGDVVLATWHRPTGSESRWRLRKLSGLDGSAVWQVDWPATGDTFGEAASAMALHTNDDIALTGRSAASGVSDTPHMTTVRVAKATGAVLWTSVQEAESAEAFIGLDVKVDASGDVVAVGAAASGHLLVRYDGSTGDTVWHRVVSGLRDPVLMAMDPLGETLLTGKRPFIEQLRAIQVSASGDQRWQRDLVHAPADFLDQDAVASDAGGNWFLTSRSTAQTQPTPTLMTLRVDRNDGETLWERHDPGQSGASAVYRTMGAAADGSALIAWPSRQLDGNTDIVLKKYTGATGVAAWSAKESDASMPDTLDCGSAARTSSVAADGSVVYAACRRVHDAGVDPLHGVLVASVSRDGQEQWARTIAGPLGSSAIPIDMELDDHGDVHLVVRLRSSLPDTHSDVIWIELDGADGSELHHQVIQRTQATNAGASLAIDPAHPSALFLAFVDGRVQSSRMVVRRYALDGHALEWERVQQPTGGESVGLGLSGFDRYGNVVLGGSSSFGAQGNASTYRVLDADTGLELWGVQAAPVNAFTSVPATALASNGDLLVAQNIGGQFRLTRHQPSGAEVWSRSYATPAGRGMQVRAMAIGPDDSIGLGGQTADGFLPTSGDYAVALVRGSDGTLLWQTVEGWFNSAPTGVFFDTEGELRTVGLFQGAEGGRQTHVVDYELASGARLAAIPLAGVGSIRYHSLEDGSRRLVDGTPTLEGHRIRVRRVDVEDTLFSDGFEFGPTL